MGTKVIRTYDIARDERGRPVRMYWTGDTVVKTNCKLCHGTGKYRGITGRDNECLCLAAVEAAAAAALGAEDFKKLSRPEQIAYRVRFNAERWALINGYSRTLQHMCGLCSAAYIHALRREGFEASAVEGFVGNWGHAWVEHSGKIFDLTYTQFDPNAQKVFITKPRDKRYKKRARYAGKKLESWLTDYRLLTRAPDIRALIKFDEATH